MGRWKKKETHIEVISSPFSRITSLRRWYVQSRVTEKTLPSHHTETLQENEVKEKSLRKTREVELEATAEFSKVSSKLKNNEKYPLGTEENDQQCGHL